MTQSTRRKITCTRGHVFYKSSTCPVCPKCWSGYHKDRVQSDFPKIGAPALRALMNARITSLMKLAKHTKADIGNLHGMGPKALGILQRALTKKSLSFKK